jgi:putative endonuclease
MVRAYVYIGLTNNIDRRILDHNSGYNKTTKPYKPHKLIYTKEFSTRLEARTHEKYLKTSVGRRYLKTLIRSSSLPADSE